MNVTREDRLEKKTRLDHDAQLLTFRLDDQEYALHIADVVQVVRMVAITPAPKAPEIMEGMINVRGRVVPVVNLRKRLGLPFKPYGLDNHLLIAQTDGRVMALIVDVVSEMRSVPSSHLDYASEIASQTSECLLAVGKLEDKLLLVLDSAKILSFEEERRLEDILAELGAMLTPENGKRLERALTGAAYP
jgi:purine-binding chemotaxis protein CheW